MLDAVYDEYRAVQCNAWTTSKLRSNGDASGLAPPYAADYSFNIYADVLLPINESINISAGVSMAGSDGYCADRMFIEEMCQKKYLLCNAYLDVAAADNRWSSTLLLGTLATRFWLAPILI